MRIPLSWLKEYIDINQTPAQIAKTLTLAGLEVDGIETTGSGFSNVVVGRVTHTEKHPEADKLCIATVTDGKDSFQVVCGAPNCREGLKTAFAMVGATLPDDEGKSFKVKRAKLRGVESFGMLCSAKELRLGDEHEGIIEFADHVKEGADVAEMYSDSVFEISLTPNLGHCASLIGIARELSAATKTPVKHPVAIVQEDAFKPIASQAKVTVEDKKRCPRYACRVINDVKIAPSPDWLQKKLVASGLRPINNVVDITNYVLLELGHPLHAFDYDRLEGHEIIVNCATEGEKFITLDGKERILSADDLLIRDKAKGIAIAGVMGGQNTEVTDSTKNILLESAYFQPTSIRKTSKRQGLQTDSSKRFERGADPNNVLKALDRAAMLIQQIADGKVAKDIIDVKEGEFPEKVVTCRLSRINSILGNHLGISEVESVFQRLGMPYRWDGRDTFTVTVPTYRVDVNIEIDLIEEVVRIYGFENLVKTAPKYTSSNIPHSPIFLFEREIRSRLIAEGLQEFLTCDLIGPSSLDVIKGSIMPEEAMVKVLNPTSIEQSILRTSMLPGLLQMVKFNWDHQNPDISGFEVGRIHFKKGDQFKEQTTAAVILSGKNKPHSWDKKPYEVDFFDLKGIVENLLQQLGISNYVFKENNLHTFHSGRQASIYVGDLEVGSIGEVHPSIIRRLDVPQRIYFAELNLHDLYTVRKSDQRMQEIPVFPCSERDWTITLKEEAPIEKVFQAIRAIRSNLLEDVTLIDIYRSDKLGAGLKNVTLRFVYRDKKKTIAQEAVDTEHARIMEETVKALQSLKLTG